MDKVNKKLNMIEYGHGSFVYPNVKIETYDPKDFKLTNSIIPMDQIKATLHFDNKEVGLYSNGEIIYTTMEYKELKELVRKKSILVHCLN
jgi:hypothetical protein